MLAGHTQVTPMVACPAATAPYAWSSGTYLFLVPRPFDSSEPLQVQVGGWWEKRCLAGCSLCCLVLPVLLCSAA
jgi:hypothetical protein